MDKATVTKALAPLMKATGYTKRNATWHKQFPDAVGVFNLQASDFGPTIYFNIGVYFRALGDNPKPPENHCHIKARLDAIAPDKTLVRLLGDFEEHLDDAERCAQIVRVVETVGIPWLERMTDLQAARKVLLAAGRTPYLVMASVRDLLRVPYPGK